MNPCTKKQNTTHCMGELGKLRHLLSILCRAVNDGGHDPEDIEGALGIAWDITNTTYKILDASNSTPLESNVTIVFHGDANIAFRIQLAREKLGLSEADLARRLNTYSNHISDWESGITEPPASMIIPLANALKCDPLWLLTGNATRQPPATPVHQSRCHHSEPQRSDASDHASHHARSPSQA